MSGMLHKKAKGFDTMKARRMIAMVLCMLLLASCTPTVPTDTPSDTPGEAPSASPATPAPSAQPSPTAKVALRVHPYSDVRADNFIDVTVKRVYEQGEYRPEDIITLTYNEGTVFKGSEALQKQIMDNGRNPGLGIRKLHGQGVTGKGVNVAIIDQTLLPDHPEFDGKIAAYFDEGLEDFKDQGSMHAPAVASLLVGDTVGVAPGARLYFAAIPAWNQDCKDYVAALNWIVEQSRKLPEGEKIRVVSISATPDDPHNKEIVNKELWKDALAAAWEEGILVCDASGMMGRGFVDGVRYDPADPEDVTLCRPAYLRRDSNLVIAPHRIGVPIDYRTVAEGYVPGFASYQYTGEGGISWGIPYFAGVLALGWQVNPLLDKDEIVDILFETSHVMKDGSKVVNPPAFIERIQQMMQ